MFLYTIRIAFLQIKLRFGIRVYLKVTRPEEGEARFTRNEKINN